MSQTLTMTDTYQGHSGSSLTFNQSETQAVSAMIQTFRDNNASYHFITRSNLKTLIEEIDISILIDEPLPIFAMLTPWTKQGHLNLLRKAKEKTQAFLDKSPAASFEII